MDLVEHIRSPGSIREIAAYLDNLPLHRRAGELLSLGRREQRTLYLKAQCADPVTPEDLVTELPEGQGLRHHGHNTLPVFKSFEKHFARMGDQIVGYNHGPTLSWIGPGFFVCRPTEGPTEQARGAMVADYWLLPEQVPEHWPAIVPNTKGLQRFVYHGTRDYLRKVTDGVVIGSAYMSAFSFEVRLHSYFVLVRGAP